MYKKLGVLVSLLLCGCTTDPVPDEEYEGPAGNFPLLGTVPDRPILPPQDELTLQQWRLQEERDEATKKQAEILKKNK